MFNTGQFIIRRSSILKQSFINNKKMYNLSVYKNRLKGYNCVIIKKIHTTSNYNSNSFLSGGNNNGPNLYVIMSIIFASTSCYFIFIKF
jgi:hypothetical protein